MNYEKKVYLAHSIATTGEFNDSIRVANEIRKLGYEVYAAAENNEINDKSNEPTPADIYDQDTVEIFSSDVFVINLTGGLQDGTIAELGLIAGRNESWYEIYDDYAEIDMPIIAYTSNARLQYPQFYRGIPSAGANHYVLGIIDKFGKFVGNEGAMLKELGYLHGVSKS